MEMESGRSEIVIEGNDTMSQDWLRTSEDAAALVAASGAPTTPLVDRSGPFVRIGERTIRRVARLRMAGQNIVSIFLRQAFYEARVARWKKVSFRGRENERARRAYCAMSPADFDGINARQRWANWHVIPRNLDGRLPSGPVRAIDLCCGVGHSTEVL